MNNYSLTALSPLDGRYADKTQDLAVYFNEAQLIHQRINIELAYFLALSKTGIFRQLNSSEIKLIKKLGKFSLKNCQQVKQIETKTYHDVKAVEYFLADQFKKSSLKNLTSWLHFGLTSEDINNLAYRCMVKSSLNKVILPSLKELLSQLISLSSQYAGLAMLARTHGQSAVPTTLGKELAVFLDRANSIYQKITKFHLKGKCSGAIGGYHSFRRAYPKFNWQKFFKKFIKFFGFGPVSISTQINPQDDLVELSQYFHHLNSVLIGLNQDIWRYISDGWLSQKAQSGQVGSSTMPQKINPIDFENSEGNLKMANGILNVFIDSFPVSRLQRDLSDSTVRRNLGVVLGHCLLAYKSLSSGLNKINPCQDKIQQDLLINWNILAEAIQISARQNKNGPSYQKISQLTKNKTLSQSDWRNLAKQIDPKLTKLTPLNYLGDCQKLALETTERVAREIKQKFKKGKKNA